MINNRNKILSLILISLSFLNVFGQTEFLVKINPSNGTFTKVDSLPGMNLILVSPNYLTYNKNNHHYIFVGSYNGNYSLYSVDVNTGNIISSPSISPSANLFYELKYDNVSNTLYGLHRVNSENREYFVSVNPTNGVYTIIDSLPGVKSVTTEPHFTTFDETNHRYIFKGGDNNGNYYLYSVDANTGNIISNPVFPVLSDPSDYIIGLQYDNSSNILYGLHWVNSENREYLVSVNPTTGIFTTIDSLPGVKLITTVPHYFTFDEINHHYIFRGRDNNGNYHLYSVDATSGSIISSPLFPVLADPSDNVIELQFDNSSGILYALHWEANTIAGIYDKDIACDLKVPNAFSPNNDGNNDGFCLQGWMNCIKNFTVIIYDRWGEKVYESNDANFCWDGIYKNKPLEAGVFVYYIKAVSTKGEPILKKGNISLIK